MVTSVFEHPWQSGLFGDAELGRVLSPERQLAAMIRVEQAFALALGVVGVVPSELASRAAEAIGQAKIDMASLAQRTGQDGVAVPDLVRQIKEQASPELYPAIHQGMSSQDVVDTALVIGLTEVAQVLDVRLARLDAAFVQLAARFGASPLMGRTRMQAAQEMTAADRIDTWRAPLAEHRERLVQLRPRLLRLQLGGAVGNRAALGQKAAKIAATMARTLSLEEAPHAWHATRAGLVDFAGWLSLITGSLGKIGQDVVLMAQQGINEIDLAGGGTSSAMPHKQNPVLAELLVTLARFNATQLTGMHHGLVHEQERSGAAWALEWMILPQMIMAAGRSLKAGSGLVASIRRIGNAS